MLAGWPLRAKSSAALLGLFCAVIGGASASYPGGSWLHPQATGFSLLENFWCDLLRRTAHNGSPNGTAAALALVGFVTLSLSLIGFWPEVAKLLPSDQARFVRRAGVASALATALVALLPSDRFPSAHAPVVLFAGGMGFGCGGVCGAWVIRHFRRDPVYAAASCALLAAASANLVLYARVAYFGGPNTLLLPIVQKVATACLVFWMLAGLRASVKRVSSAPRPRP